MKEHELFKGLADQTRLRIVVMLLEQELCVCDLVAVLRLPQSTVSRHMARLRSAGLVIDRRNGKWVHYRLDQSRLVTDLRQFLKRSFTRIDLYRRDQAMLKRYMATGKCARNGALN